MDNQSLPERLRRAVADFLDIDLDIEDMAALGGVGDRTWRRYIEKNSVPRSVIKLVWFEAVFSRCRVLEQDMQDEQLDRLLGGDLTAESLTKLARKKQEEWMKS